MKFRGCWWDKQPPTMLQGMQAKQATSLPRAVKGGWDTQTPTIIVGMQARQANPLPLSSTGGTSNLPPKFREFKWGRQPPYHALRDALWIFTSHRHSAKFGWDMQPPCHVL
jgi:hypothetical protein